MEEGRGRVREEAGGKNQVKHRWNTWVYKLLIYREEYNRITSMIQPHPPKKRQTNPKLTLTIFLSVSNYACIKYILCIILIYLFHAYLCQPRVLKWPIFLNLYKSHPISLISWLCWGQKYTHHLVRQTTHPRPTLYKWFDELWSALKNSLWLPSQRTDDLSTLQ